MERTPVWKGPVKHPLETRYLSSPTGLGNAILGGPEAPFAASWMCVAVRAGDWYGPVTPKSSISWEALASVVEVDLQQRS